MIRSKYRKWKPRYHGFSKMRRKTNKKEILWIFFGIHTANALEIGRRMQSKASKQVA